MINVVIVDDHYIVRRGLRSLLEMDTELEIVGEAENGADALSLIEQTRPNVLIVDITMPGMNGIELTKVVSERWPDVRVIILSIHIEEGYLQSALASGAHGYVLKGATMDEMLRAVHDVASGRRYLSQPLAEYAIQGFLRNTTNSSRSDFSMLTAREQEVCLLAVEGLNNNEIAARLSISGRTVETHRANIMRKLGLRTQTDLVRYAIRHKLI